MSPVGHSQVMLGDRGKPAQVQQARCVVLGRELPPESSKGHGVANGAREHADGDGTAYQVVVGPGVQGDRPVCHVFGFGDHDHRGRGSLRPQRGERLERRFAGERQHHGVDVGGAHIAV